MTRREIYKFILNTVYPSEIAHYYLGDPYRISGDSLVYFSPLREKERTPSFFVNNEKGIHDFGTGKHYNIISFCSELFDTCYWTAAKKIIIDFGLNLGDVKKFKTNNQTNKKEKIKINMVTGNKPNKIICYFDEIGYNYKPKEFVAEIKNRIQENNFIIYNSVEQIKNEILQGKTCIPSAIRGNPKEKWRMQQLFFVDFDNKIDGENITIENPSHVSAEKIINYCRNIELLPTIIYNTFSHTEEQHKFRLVYIFEEPITNIEIAQKIQNYLLEKLKIFNPDTSKRNLSDMFFGGISIKYSGTNYYKIIMED